MVSTISFPESLDTQSNILEEQSSSPITNFPNLSMISIPPASSLEICQSVYGETASSYDAIERFYEPNAVYENPFLTTTSRAMLSDIHNLSRQFNSLDVPRPLAVIYALFGVEPPQDIKKPLLHALKVWTEIGDISETEGFDGHRKAIVEHTLNVLVLPGIHTDSMRSGQFSQSTESLSSSPLPSSSSSHPSHPALAIPGTSLTLPSPLHSQLHIITRLVFNEQGRVTHHRDFWDIKEVVRLIPGVPLTQWIGTRVAALVLTYVARSWLKKDSSDASTSSPNEKDLERGMLSAYKAGD